MGRLIGLIGVVFLGVLLWKIGSRLSADAIGLATGVVFGVLAGLPTALLVLTSNRRRDDNDEADRRQGGAYPYGAYPQQPPVIVVTGGQAPALGGQPAAEAGYGERNSYQRALPAPAPEPRQFRIVGAAGERLDEDFA